MVFLCFALVCVLLCVVNNNKTQNYEIFFPRFLSTLSSLFPPKCDDKQMQQKDFISGKLEKNHATSESVSESESERERERESERKRGS